MSDVFCIACGASLAATARFCSSCGEPQPIQEAASPLVPVLALSPPLGAARSPVTAPTTGSSRYGATLPPPPRPSAAAVGVPSVPAELLAVCGLMALGGVFTLWPALKVLPDLLKALGAGGLAAKLALLLLAFW